jgi:hypothetical protein
LNDILLAYRFEKPLIYARRHRQLAASALTWIVSGTRPTLAAAPGWPQVTTAFQHDETQRTSGPIQSFVFAA